MNLQIKEKENKNVELSSYPIIDFIETIEVDCFELHGKQQFIYY